MMRECNASAPGRVNLMGDHTDYNGGFVLPMPIPQRATARLTPHPGLVVTARSRELADEPASYRLGEERRSGTWLDYLMGCTDVLRRSGHELGGFDVEIASDVPLGAGLSSSAALEVAFLRALRAANDLPIDDRALALLAQRAENEIVGAPVGAMDQLVSSLGSDGAALFLDMRSFAATVVPIPPSMEVVVISSGISHRLAAGEGYRTRRAECEAAAQALGVETLRDVGVGDLERIAALPEPLGRRARHVVTEDARVLETVAAIEREDAAALGLLFAASHASMRDDFEVSIAEIDRLVEIAVGDADVIGARLTGGGFGGSIVALARSGKGGAAGARIADSYRHSVGREANVLLPIPTHAASVEERS